MGRPINTAIILECWDEVVRLAASLKARTVAPNVMLKKLGAYHRQNRLDFALQEIGRIEQALFTLDWLESKDRRRRCLAGLNKSEVATLLRRLCSPKSRVERPIARSKARSSAPQG
jgi:TnpA family transposase